MIDCHCQYHFWCMGSIFSFRNSKEMKSLEDTLAALEEDVLWWHSLSGDWMRWTDIPMCVFVDMMYLFGWFPYENVVLLVDVPFLGSTTRVLISDPIGVFLRSTRGTAGC